MTVFATLLNICSSNMKSLQIVFIYFMVIQGRDICEPDWVSFRQFCYLFSTTKETHGNATATCIYNDAELAEIEDRKDIDFVTRETNTSNTIKRRKYFIRGMCLDGVTFTIQNEVPLKYTHWKASEPNILYEQKCLVLILKGKLYELTERQMSSQYCTIAYYYICRKPSVSISTTFPIDTSVTSTDISEATTLSSTNKISKLDTTVSDSHITNTTASTAFTSGTGTSAVPSWTDIEVPNTSTTASNFITATSTNLVSSTIAVEGPIVSATASTAFASRSDTSASLSALATEAAIATAAAPTAIASGTATNATTTFTVTSDTNTNTLSNDASVGDNSPAIITSLSPNISSETSNGAMSATSLTTDDLISSTSETVRISSTADTNSSISTASIQRSVVVDPTKRVVILESVDFVPVVKEAEGSAIIGVLGIIIVFTLLFCIACSDVGVMRINFKYLKESLSSV